MAPTGRTYPQHTAWRTDMRRATNFGSSTPRSHRSRWLSPDHDTLAALLRDNIDSAGSSSYSSSSSSSDGSGPRSLACSYFPFRRTTAPASEPTAALVPGGAYTLSSVHLGTSRDPGSPLAPGSPLFGGPAQSRDPMLASPPRATVHSTGHGGLTTALASSSVAATAGESNSYGYSGTASASAPASVSSSRWDNGGGGGSGRVGGTVGGSDASGASGSRTAGGGVLSLTERNLRRTSGFYEYLRTERDRAGGSDGAGNGGLTRRESLLATLNEVGSRLSGERR